MVLQLPWRVMKFGVDHDKIVIVFDFSHTCTLKWHRLLDLALYGPKPGGNCGGPADAAAAGFSPMKVCVSTPCHDDEQAHNQWLAE